VADPDRPLYRLRFYSQHDCDFLSRRYGGVFGNITGGYKGALLAGFITSTVVAWGQYFCVTGFIDNTIPDTALWAGDSDMFVLAPVIHLLTRLLAF
jgi:PTS system ascorbate-specific IIC component